MDRRAIWILSVSALSLACELEPVSRHVQLAAEDGWPRAQTAFVGDALRVEVTRMEPLRASSAVYAWVMTHDDTTVRAGPVTPGEPTFFAAQALGVEWTHVHEVMLTEESATGTPTAPSTSVLFRGTPGAALSPDVTGSLTGATATAHLQDDTLTLTTTSLPLTGPRLFYGVWLVGSNAAAAADGGSDATLVGRVYGSRTETFSNLRAPALRNQVVVTVEFESGPDAPALSSVVLRGAIPTTAIATGPGAAPAAPEPAGGGHAH